MTYIEVYRLSKAITKYFGINSIIVGVTVYRQLAAGIASYLQYYKDFQSQPKTKSYAY